MKKNFTKLVYAGIACFYMVSAMAQERVGVRTAEAAPLKQDVELRAGALADSIITYAATGEKTEKTVYIRDEQGRVIQEEIFKWENNRWVNNEKRISTYDANGETRRVDYYSWESNNWEYQGWSTGGIPAQGIWGLRDGVFFCNYIPGMLVGFTYGFVVGTTDWEYRTEVTKDAKGNITGIQFFVYQISNPNNFYLAYDHVITYNDKNLPVSINVYNSNNELTRTVKYEYDPNENIILCEDINFRYPQYNRTFTASYDSNNNLISGGTDESKTIYQMDSDGNLAIEKFYTWTASHWYMTHYTISYPNALTPAVSPENSAPVGNDNQGSFDVNVNIPTDSIGNGSITVTFPEGFTLDENSTGLTLDFAGLFDLTITKQENNSWLLEIQPKTLRSALLRAGEAGKMLQVAYTVDKGIEKGTYDISVNSILFETKSGNYIPEPAITVPAVLTRESVANELIESAGIMLYLIDRTLYIQSEKADRITVYSTVGQQLYETAIQPGMNTVNAANLPQGILIVRGSSGWVMKVANR